jgi:SAM-dependent methyltransferase
MTGDSIDRVRSLYDAYPYPSPVAGDGLISDTANLVAFLFPASSFPGRKILDAGCGTAHRLLGFAKRFPEASFCGVDVAAAPLAVARDLAARHGIRNVEFRQGDLLSWSAEERFDLIVSTGVVHHLVDPESGLRNLCASLAPGGGIILWLYHPYGEFGRLLQRELVHALWDGGSMSLGEGLETLRALDISLAPDRYSGAYAKQDNRLLDQSTIDADAVLHPVVNAYRFGDSLDMLGRCGMDWGAVHSVSLGADTRLIDLSCACPPALSAFCLKHERLLAAPALQERFRQLDTRSRLKVIELIARPNGYAIVAGREDARARFDARMLGNMVDLSPRGNA